jgi:predicted nucleic acid-binding protein
MILLDSSVVFDHTRGRDPRLAAHFSTFPVAVCGVVRAEVLCGARHPADRAALIRLLDSLAQVPTPEPIWDVVGDTLATLRTNGVTVPFPDAVLATLAIINDLELWTRDTHFALVQRHLPALKLFPEPP